MREVSVTGPSIRCVEEQEFPLSLFQRFSRMKSVTEDSPLTREKLNPSFSLLKTKPGSMATLLII